MDILDSSHDCVHLKLSPMNKKRDRFVRRRPADSHATSKIVIPSLTLFAM